MKTYTIYEKDKCLQQIEKQIQLKKSFLLERKKYLENIIQQNRFLEGVKNDYLKYNNYIVDEKQQQINALNILSQYIDKIIIDGNLTKRDIIKRKKEQQEIINELKIIKENLDNITNKK